MSLLSQATDNPKKRAVIMAGSGETRTYGELVDGMNRLARVLRSQCEIGDRVAMLMENERDYFTVAWLSSDIVDGSPRSAVSADQPSDSSTSWERSSTRTSSSLALARTASSSMIMQ